MAYVLGVSLKRWIQLILAILSLVFLLLENQGKTHLGVAVAIVSIYLVLVVVMALASHDISGSGTQAIDCAAGLLVMFEAIHMLMYGGQTTLVVAAAILSLCLGILFWIVALF